MNTANKNQTCANCPEREAAYHDNTGDSPLCSDCAKDAALDRLEADGEIESLTAPGRITDTTSPDTAI